MEGFIRVILNGVPGESYNIGNPNPEISVIELLEKMEFILGKKINYNVVDYPDSYPADEPNRRCPDILKAKIPYVVTKGSCTYDLKPIKKTKLKLLE